MAALELGTRAQLAKLLGVTSPAVHYAIKSGRLQRSLREREDGTFLIELATAILEWHENTDMTKSHSNGEAQGAHDPAVPSISDSKRLKSYYGALNERLAFEKEAVKLVYADTVKAQFFEAGRVTRDRIMGCVDELAAVCENQPAYVIRRQMKEKLAKALSELAERKLDLPAGAGA